MRPFEIVAAAAATVGVCLCLGLFVIRVCLRHDRCPANNSPLSSSHTTRALLGFLVGAASLSSIVFWTCVLRIAYWQVFIAIGAASLLLVRRRLPPVRGG